MNIPTFIRRLVNLNPDPDSFTPTLASYTTEKIFIEDGWYKIKDVWNKDNQVVCLSKLEEGEDYANKIALEKVTESFNSAMLDFGSYSNKRSA